MPAQLNYPGVYIEELPSGVRTISGVATAIAAFAGSAPRGPINKAVRLFSFSDYDMTAPAATTSVDPTPTSGTR